VYELSEKEVFILPSSTDFRVLSEVLGVSLAAMLFTVAVVVLETKLLRVKRLVVSHSSAEDMKAIDCHACAAH
jgi:hypothetical protein